MAAKEYYDNSGISTDEIEYIPVYPKYATNYTVDKKETTVVEELNKLNKRLDRIIAILEEIKKELK